MKTLAIVAMTGDSEWRTPSLSLGPFILGRGFEAPEHETLADGSAVFRGYTALGILQRHDYVILQHWPGEHIVRSLKEAGVKVGFWVNLLSIQTSPYWNQVQEPMRLTLANFAMKGSDGKPVVTWPGAEAIDPTSETFPMAVCGALQYILETSFRYASPDFFFVDELTDFPFLPAKNAPLELPDWRAGVQRVCEAIGGMFASVWGHNTGTAYPSVRRIVQEHSTRGVTSAEDFVERAKTYAEFRNGTLTTSMVGLGWERSDDVPAEWVRNLRDRSHEVPAQLLIQTARTGKSFQIFDPFKEGA